VSPLGVPNPSCPDDDWPSEGVADVPWSLGVDAEDEDELELDEVFADASALWSPAAMKPTSAPPTATVTPAARIRPCVLRLRRAMGELSSRRVRVC
jgi:hypothetical protein